MFAGKDRLAVSSSKVRPGDLVYVIGNEVAGYTTPTGGNSVTFVPGDPMLVVSVTDLPMPMPRAHEPKMITVVYVMCQTAVYCQRIEFFSRLAPLVP